MKFVILYLILDASTGQPLEVGKHSETVYAELEHCEKARAGIGPQKPIDGRVRVFTCASEKQVTVL